MTPRAFRNYTKGRGLAPLLDAARAGDEDAVVLLIERLPRALLGFLLVEMHRADTPLPVRRSTLRHLWIQAHTIVLAACGAAGVRPLDLFRGAAYPIGPEVPERLWIWRGTHGVRLEVAEAGLSWTPERSAACWYAARGYLGPAAQRRRLVLRRQVLREQVLFHEPAGDQYRMPEVIAEPSAPGATVVDGDPAEWQATAAAWEAAVLGGDAA